MKTWKVMAALCAGMVMITLIIAFICRSTYTDMGLNDISTVTEYLDFCKKVTVKAFDREMAEYIKENRDYYIKGVSQEGGFVHHKLQVFIVEVEEREGDKEVSLLQRGIEIVQYVKVVKVLQGDAIEGETINIYSELSGIVVASNGAAYNYGVEGKNVMLPGYQYLVFCEAVENMEELADYEGMPLKYREISALFSQLNITTDMMTLLNEDESLTDWENIEFYVYHQEVLEALLDIKHEILETYGITVGESYP